MTCYNLMTPCPSPALGEGWHPGRVVGPRGRLKALKRLHQQLQVARPRAARPGRPHNAPEATPSPGLPRAVRAASATRPARQEDTLPSAAQKEPLTFLTLSRTRTAAAEGGQDPRRSFRGASRSRWGASRQSLGRKQAIELPFLRLRGACGCCGAGAPGVRGDVTGSRTLLW